MRVFYCYGTGLWAATIPLLSTLKEERFVLTQRGLKWRKLIFCQGRADLQREQIKINADEAEAQHAPCCVAERMAQINSGGSSYGCSKTPAERPTGEFDTEQGCPKRNHRYHGPIADGSRLDIGYRNKYFDNTFLHGSWLISREGRNGLAV